MIEKLNNLTEDKIQTYIYLPPMALKHIMHFGRSKSPTDSN